MQKPKLNANVWRRRKISKVTTKNFIIKSIFYVTRVCDKNNVCHDSIFHDAIVIDLIKTPHYICQFLLVMVPNKLEKLYAISKQENTSLYFTLHFSQVVMSTNYTMYMVEDCHFMGNAT